tara:strand:+ start:1767 stop:3077 length:1311 start_codon:yes stop_codon:yes gene_type:complete
MVNLHIPLLFDISAGGIVFGEAVSSLDMFDSHLKFQLYGDSGAGLIDEFKKILYGDTSESDLSGVLFYTSDSTNIADTLAQILIEKVLGENSKLIQPVGDWTNKYKPPGIPLPNYAGNFASTGRPDGPDPSDNVGYDVTGQDYYTGGITDGTGTSFGRTLIRLMSAHLMGHPFAQAFLANEQDILRDVSNAPIGNQLQERLLKNDPVSNPVHGSGNAGKVDISSVNIVTAHATNNEFDLFEPTLKTKGIRNSILQSLYGGLLYSDVSRFDLCGNNTGDDAENAGDYDSSYNIPRRMPFRTGDTLSFYFRPRVLLSTDENVSTPGDVYYTNPDLSGVGQGNNELNTSKNVQDIFYQPRHRWVAHQSAAKIYNSSSSSEFNVMGNGYDTYMGAASDLTPNILMTGTDLQRNMMVDGGVLGTGNKTMFDGHVWRVKINL